MSTKVGQVRDELRNRLNTVEGRLQSFKTNIKSLSQQGERDLRAKLDAARTKHRAQKDRIEKARANRIAEIHRRSPKT